ncbi:hypothetical protein Dred_0477 [Desulforamulus reducens MI-1]|uniref:Uncharacterized protein n=1 Tax=Desulforamulus reducens (strain ATCC BAA-1160 / DSM 100696 / MI-1) TaxID=349161 RepID=A4J1S0_DESRM|nr:hypothetical protein [Desulforamulus reducens]ABO49023.1 hypothetical protein Dred_0477 [Desulforamulus reducens MI-1]
MRSYLYPAFTLESEDFERVLPSAIKFSQTHNVPCRVLREANLFIISFEDKAVSRGIIYGHQLEKEMDHKFSKYAICDVFYLSKEQFEKGKGINNDKVEE